ncbi:MAG: 50S ribosomal protein L11 methyltransferase [Pseudomonadota bacterium]
MADYLQIGLVVRRAQAQAVDSLFESMGVLSTTVESANDEIQVDESAPSNPKWEMQRINGLFHSPDDKDEFVNQACISLVTAGIQSVEVVVESIEDRDWENAWLKNFKPLRIDSTLWICPSWCSPVDESAVNIMIDPGMAFGTGDHETTEMCLSYISSLGNSGWLDGKAVADYGAGSGILAIACAMFGADRVVAYDNDHRAVESCSRNARVNVVEDRVQSRHIDEFEVERFDLVLANILAPTLKSNSSRLMDMMVDRDSSKIALSGILEHQVTEVLSYFEPLVFDTTNAGDWILLSSACQPQVGHK